MSSVSSSVKINGKCLCGSVVLKAAVDSLDGGVCHCSMCRTWGGGPYFGLDCGKDVRVMGEQSVTVYASSEWAERGFCARCGTHLFYRLRTGQYHLPMGILEDDAGARLTHQIFIDEKPAYYVLADDLPAMTGKEVFEQYNGSK